MGLPELYLAIDGYKEANAVDDTQNPLSRDEMEELMERFPD